MLTFKIWPPWLDTRGTTLIGLCHASSFSHIKVRRSFSTHVWVGDIGINWKARLWRIMGWQLYQFHWHIADESIRSVAYSARVYTADEAFRFLSHSQSKTLPDSLDQCLLEDLFRIVPGQFKTWETGTPRTECRF